MTINLQKIEDALPDRAIVTVESKGVLKRIKVLIPGPSLSEAEFEECKQWQREIIGQENISEFYTEEEGHLWYVYLKKDVIEFEFS